MYWNSLCNNYKYTQRLPDNSTRYKDITLEINNFRSTTVYIINASFSNPSFNLVNTTIPIIIEPFSSFSTTIRFSPQSIGNIVDILAIYSNDFIGNIPAKIRFEGDCAEYTEISGVSLIFLTGFS